MPSEQCSAILCTDWVLQCRVLSFTLWWYRLPRLRHPGIRHKGLGHTWVRSLRKWRLPTATTQVINPPFLQGMPGSKRDFFGRSGCNCAVRHVQVELQIPQGPWCIPTRLRK